MLEPIKVSVDVNVHLSEKTEQFILGLFSGKSVNNTKPAAPAAKPESKPAAIAAKPESKPAAPAAKPESKPAAIAAKPESKPAATAAKPESKPANTASDNISIEDVREALSKKIATHRSEIKEKLTELGAPSVTKLDKSKYSNMLNFLNSLD
jgi:hypothetical protein